MSVREIISAWVVLLALSLATVALTITNIASPRVGAAALLALSGLKARTILGRYLELSHSRFWTRVFDVAIGLFLLLAYGLYLIGQGRVP